MSTTFLLIRHGLTDWVGKALSGHLPGVHLNETGRAQAASLPQRLRRFPITAIYSSPLERTIQTAEPVALDRGLEIRQRPRLIEIDFGAWSGRTLAELQNDPGWKRFNTFRSGMRIPDGDIMLDVQRRVVDEFEDIRTAHPDETVAVFSHQDTLKAAVAHYSGMPLDLFHRFEMQPASISILELAEWGPRLLCLNNTGEF